MKKAIKHNLQESVQLSQDVLNNQLILKNIHKACEIIIENISLGNKILLCGNGGSAADAQHIASEFTGKYYRDRPPINAEALHTDTSYLTAVSNDYGYQDVFSRMIEAKAQKGDVLIAMSTSGNSKNVVKAINKANSLGVYTIGLGGGNTGKIAPLCQTYIGVPSKNTARIQEMHLLIGHTICEIVEAHFYQK